MDYYREESISQSAEHPCQPALHLVELLLQKDRRYAGPIQEINTAFKPSTAYLSEPVDFTVLEDGGCMDAILGLAPHPKVDTNQMATHY